MWAVCDGVYSVYDCSTHTHSAKLFTTPVCAKIILKVVLRKYIKHRIYPYA